MTNAPTILYNGLVCILGISLLICLIYSVFSHKDTVSDAMIHNTPYRIAVSTCIMLQGFFWATCMYSKRWMDPDAAAWGFLCLGIAVVGWIGLTTILDGIIHFVFVVIFIAFFLLVLLILCSLTWQRHAVDTLVLSVAFLLVSIIAMIILFNTNQFYVMEHVGFIAYGIIFTVFFLVHPPNEWGAGIDDDYYTQHC